MTDTYSQGRLLDTHNTLKWSAEERAKVQAEEACRVFKNFSRADEGRSRIWICTCPTAESAKEVARLLNLALSATWRLNLRQTLPKEDSPGVTIRQRITELLAEHGDSIRETSRILNISPGYLSRLHRGEKTNPSAETLDKLGLCNPTTTYERKANNGNH